MVSGGHATSHLARWAVAARLFCLLGLVLMAFSARAATPQLAYSESTGCLLKQDGSVTCWGYPDSGQASPPAGPFERISMGTWSACGLRPSGQVECWGGENVTVGGLTTVPPGTFTQVDAGGSFNCALRDDQKVVCWGAQVGGEWLPFPGVDDDFVRVSTGRSAVCAIRTTGEIACNGLGQISAPQGTFIDVFVSGDTHCALRPDRTLYCWGHEFYGQTNPPPGQFVFADLGAHHGCGLRTDGEIRCWGYYGNQDYLQYFPPQGQYTSLGVGWNSNCALRADGVMKCWGIDQAGEAPRFVIEPKVIEAAQVGIPYLTQISMVDMGTVWTYLKYQPLDPLYSLSAGQLPPEFTLTGTGQLQGTASATGEWLVRLFGQDARGFEVERDLAFTVVNPGEDVTPPLITATIDGLNQAGTWYKTDATVEWNLEDPESNVTPEVGCQTVLVDTDTPLTGVTFQCKARSTGGVSQKTVWLRRDATPPSVDVISVEPQADPNFYVARFAATDALSTVAFVECAIDDIQFFNTCLAFDGPAWTSHRFTLPDTGPHTLYIRAADNAGNYSEPVAHVVNGTPPDTTPPNIVPSVTGTLGSNDWYTSDVSISWSVTDGESSITETTGCDGNSVAADTSGVTFTCQATSAGGGSQQSVTIKRDALAPDTSLTSTPSNPSNSTSATFTFSGSDAVSGVASLSCSLDGTAYAPCTSPRVLTGLGEGTHTFAVRATDHAGLTDQSPASYSWSIDLGDTAPPIAAPVLSPLPNNFGWNNSDVTVTWNWTDSGTGINPGSCTTSTRQRTEGSLQITATCRDLAGNVGTGSTLVQIDKTNPVFRDLVRLVLLNDPNPFDPLGANFPAEDSNSGIASNSCTPLTTDTLGTHNTTCTAIDRAGNATTAKRPYTVIATQSQYEAPVAPYPVLNVMSSRTIVTLRFRVTDYFGAPVANLTAQDLRISTTFAFSCQQAPMTNTLTSATKTGFTNLGNGRYEVAVKPAPRQGNETCFDLFVPTLYMTGPRPYFGIR